MAIVYKPYSTDVPEEGEDYLVCVLCGAPWSLSHVCWQVQRRWAITQAHKIIEGNKCYIASEDVLTRDWDTPEEDEAWEDL